MPVTVRSPKKEDVAVLGRIAFEAFRGVAEEHGFPPDFPSVEVATHMIEGCIGTPVVTGFVAELDGFAIGSNFIYTAGRIHGVGPITVDPAHQGSGAGRLLMQAVLDHSESAAGIRLVQDAFNGCSMALYASLGFDAKEPLVQVQGRPRPCAKAEANARAMEQGDLEECAELCRRIHGFDRSADLTPGPWSRPWVAERDGRITAYATAPHLWFTNHAVGETEEDLEAVLAGFAEANPEPLWFLLPIRQAGLFRWCLSAGLRVGKPMTLMAMREYQEPAGAWLPAVSY